MPVRTGVGAIALRHSIGAATLSHQRKHKHNTSPPAQPEAGGRLGTPMTAIMEAIEHLHDRPAWDCRVCKQPWPCAKAKDNLLTEFRGFPSVLTIYLSGHMYDAVLDLRHHGDLAPNDLYERFISWASDTTTQGE